MDTNPVSRKFKVTEVARIAGSNDRYSVRFEAESDPTEKYQAASTETSKPELDAVLTVFFQEGALDFAYEGLTSVSRTQ